MTPPPAPPLGNFTFSRKAQAPFHAAVGKVLAEGGAGQVHEAKRLSGDPRLPEALVVKRARPGRERLIEQERDVCEQLDHPSLLRYLGTAQSPEHGVLLAFERLAPNPLLLLNGPGSRPRFRDPGTIYYPLPPGLVLELAFDLLLALEYLHARGFVHADVKLANFLVRSPNATGPAAKVLRQVAAGSYEGVLIDLGSIRSTSFLEGLALGTADPELAPGMTPHYAPPEALFELKERGGHKVFSSAMDVYAFGLVFYVLLTGELPYGHYFKDSAEGADVSLLKNPQIVNELKTREARGEASPFDASALDRIPFHDVAFFESREKVWPAFRSGVEHILTRTLDPDPTKRMTAFAARTFFEEELGLRTSMSSAARPWSQVLFQMRSRANRLAGDAPLGGIRIREEDDQVFADEAPPPKPPQKISNSVVCGEGTLRFSNSAQVRAEKRSSIPQAPDGMVRLADVLREFKAKRPLPVVHPVLVTKSGLGPNDLAKCLIYSLGKGGRRLKVDDDGEVADRMEIHVGRTPDNDIIVVDGSASKKHMSFRLVDGSWWVADNGSTNGTFVDGEAVVRGRPRRLSGTANVGIGPSTTYTFMDEESFKGYLERALELWTEAFGTRERRKATSERLAQMMTADASWPPRYSPAKIPKGQESGTLWPPPEKASEKAPDDASKTARKEPSPEETITEDASEIGPSNAEIDRARAMIEGGDDSPTVDGMAAGSRTGKAHPSAPGPTGTSKIERPQHPFFERETTRRLRPPSLSKLQTDPHAEKPEAGIPADLEARLRAHLAPASTFNLVLEGARLETLDTIQEVLDEVRAEPNAVLVIEVENEGQRVVVYQRRS